MTNQEYSPLPRSMNAELEHANWTAYVRMKQKEFSLVALGGSEDPGAEREYAHWTAIVRMKQEDYLRRRRRSLQTLEAYEADEETNDDHLGLESESGSWVDYWFTAHRYDDVDDWGGEVFSPFFPDSSGDHPHEFS